MIKLFLVMLGWCASLEAIDFLSVSGNPLPLNITIADPGLPPMPVSDGSTSYDLTTMGRGEKITGQLNTSLPPEVCLTILLEAPSSAISQGKIKLTTFPQTLVSNLPLIQLLLSGLKITYELSSTVQASPISSRSVTVILTIN